MVKYFSLISHIDFVRTMTLANKISTDKGMYRVRPMQYHALEKLSNN